MNSREQQRKCSHTESRKVDPSLYIKYPKRRVSNISSLCKAIKITPKELEEAIKNSQQQYILHKTIPKSDGTYRYIYRLKPALKLIQKRINNSFLKSCIYPSYIKGSIKGSDYIVSASMHCEKSTVIKMDVTNFFPSITQSKVAAIWRDFFNFSNEVSDALAKLCCYQGSLAQGAPVSSYLANIFFWKVEPRIVYQFKDLDFCYGRYVDDIIVSTNKKISKEEKSQAIQCIKSMMKQEGVVAKSSKTKVMDSSTPQQVHGLNVNGRSPTMPKSKRKELRAAVHRLKLKSKDSPMTLSDRAETAKLKGKIYNLMRTNKRAAEKLLKDIDIK